MVLHRQFPGEDDMSIENTANAVSDGLIVIIPINQYGVDAGDASSFAHS